MTLPQIAVNFYQYAATAVVRSSKGVVCIVLRDTASAVYSFNTALDDMTGLSTANQTLIKQCFLGNPAKVIVITLTSGQVVADAIALMAGKKFNWLVSNITTSTFQADMVTYAKSVKQKTVVYNQAANDLHVVNFVNTSVTLTDGTTQAGSDYIIRIAGLLAGLPFTQSATYYILSDLKDVVAVSSPVAGQFYLINDGNAVIRVGRAINSLTTLTTSLTADMQKITIVECLDIITEDITTEFKNNYVGKFKNRYDNQALFISAVNGYFKALADDDLLDRNFLNISSVDIIAQKLAHIASGKLAVEVNAWTDIQTKLNTFNSSMFLTNSLKVLDAIEDLLFNINLF